MYLQKAMVVGVVVLAATVSVAGAFGYQAGPPGADEVAAEIPAKASNSAPQDTDKTSEKPDVSPARQIEQLNRALEASTAKLNALQDENAMLQATIKTLKPDSANQDMASMMGAMRGSARNPSRQSSGMMGAMMGGGVKGVDQRSMMRGRAAPNEAPLSFVREESLICVVSPEGNRATEYVMETGKSYVIEFDQRLKAYPFAMGTMTAIGFHDLDSEVKQLAVFDMLPLGVHLNPGQKGSAWMTKDLDKPYKGSVLPSALTDGVFFVLGNQIHAYSKNFRTWSQLTLPDGPHRGPTVDGTLLIVEAQGHLHIYDTRQGKWIDINSRESKSP